MKNNRQGFATLIVIFAATACFSLFTIAINVNYRFHDQNKKMLKVIQKQANQIVIKNSTNKTALKKD